MVLYQSTSRSTGIDFTSRPIADRGDRRETATSNHLPAICNEGQGRRACYPTHVPEAVFYDFITLLAIVNPIEAGAAFATLTGGATPAQQKAIAARSSIVAGIILIGFGFIGDILLKALGIGFPAFRIAGGLLLLQVGFNMVFAKETGAAKLAPDERSAATLSDDPSVFPLAIPIITGPGALTTIVAIVSKQHESVFEKSLVVVVVVVVLGITFITMLASQRLTAFLGPTGVNAVGRVMGIVVAAIAIQLIVNGVLELFPGLSR